MEQRARLQQRLSAELQKIMDIVLKGEMNPLTDLTEDMPVGRKVALNLALKANGLGADHRRVSVDLSSPASLAFTGRGAVNRR